MATTARLADSTRPTRIASLREFSRWLHARVPGSAILPRDILPRRPRPERFFPLAPAEIEALMAAAPTVFSGDPMRAHNAGTVIGLLYCSGLRIAEALDAVELTGKGRKTRVIPLWPETMAAIDHYLALRECAGIASDRLFVSRTGQPMTRFGIGRRVGVLAREAAGTCPSLCGRTVTPHVFRHTTALHHIEAGNDIAVVKDWLGHADLKTTSAYLEVSLRRKRDALEKVPPPAGGEPPERPRWKQPGLMALLSRLSRGVMLPAAVKNTPVQACGTT